MTPRQVRTKVAAVATALGVAVLMAGPASTLGLGVGGTDVTDTTSQVTSTVQQVADTTQQTADTTVTQVESTVQTTTQAAAPQPAVVPQQQTQTQTTTKQTVTRAAAPVKKQASSVTRTRTAPARSVAAPTELAKQAGGASSEPVRSAVTTRTRSTRTHLAAPATDTSTTADAPAGCDIPALTALPGGSQLQALLSIVCSAADGLGLPGRIGLIAPASLTPESGGVRGAQAGGGSSPPRARSAAVRGHAPVATGGRPAAGAAQASHPGAPIGALVPAGAGHAGALVYASTIPAAHVTAAADRAAAGDSGAHHHAFFSGQPTGTQILMAIIIANLAILAGIAMWRLAVRWVIPRFA